MPKTVIEKSESSSADVTVFRIAGTLGFHEKDTLEKLFSECEKRDISRVVLDVAELSSLGGGCAKIIRERAAAGFVIGFAGAGATVLRFLSKEKSDCLILAESVPEAITLVTVHSGTAPSGDAPAKETAVQSEEPPEAATPEQPAPAEQPQQAPSAEPGEERRDQKSGRRGTDRLAGKSDRDLQKRLVQYHTLLSLNSDFYRIQDRKTLLDLYLLTMIAQVGVESAIFFDRQQGAFVPAAAKGIEKDELRGFVILENDMKIADWVDPQTIHTIEKAPFGDNVKAPLLSLGCAFFVPFIVRGETRGIVAMGQPLKGDLDEGSVEFLRMLTSQAAMAYENTSRFESDNDRTLGVVQTLISLIEENTLARGNTDFLSNYVLALAEKMHYEAEHVRDLLYGTMLRDIGMIKVSDLIVRSPRELLPEEWEIIKRHPIDGADMLERMHFTEHAIDVVRHHHERFNGEGYPKGIPGEEIPLGARIVSVVESFSAMLQERPTRPALTQEEALNTLRENWGMRYDPEVVKEFVELIEGELRTGERVADKKFELNRV